VIFVVVVGRNSIQLLTVTVGHVRIVVVEWMQWHFKLIKSFVWNHAEWCLYTELLTSQLSN